MAAALAAVHISDSSAAAATTLIGTAAPLVQQQDGCSLSTIVAPACSCSRDEGTPCTCACACAAGQLAGSNGLLEADDAVAVIADNCEPVSARRASQRHLASHLCVGSLSPEPEEEQQQRERPLSPAQSAAQVCVSVYYSSAISWFPNGAAGLAGVGGCGAKGRGTRQDAPCCLMNRTAYCLVRSTSQITDSQCAVLWIAVCHVVCHVMLSQAAYFRQQEVDELMGALLQQYPHGIPVSHHSSMAQQAMATELCSSYDRLFSLPQLAATLSCR